MMTYNTLEALQGLTKKIDAHAHATLLQPPPPGLAELNLFFELACDAHPALRAILFNDNLVALEKWAAGAALSLRFSWRTTVDGDWQWSELGQDEFRDSGSYRHATGDNV